MREVLDHLAPDADVIEAPGFKLEPEFKGAEHETKGEIYSESAKGK